LRKHFRPASRYIAPMSRLLSIALLSLLLAGTAAADRRAETAAVRGEFVTAINKRDVDAVAGRVKLPLRVRRVRFDAKACTQFSGDNVEVSKADLAAFVGCVADLGIKSLDGENDVWINAVYGPGIALILTTAGDKISTFNSYWKPGSNMIIEPVAFTSHVKKFTREIVPSKVLKKQLDAASGSVSAMLSVCIDAKGKVDGDGVVILDSLISYEDDLKAAVRKWKVEPFLFGGKKVPVCAQFEVGYPLASIDTPLQMPAPLPPPPPPPPPPSVKNADGSLSVPVLDEAMKGGSAAQNITPTLLEGYRIKGSQLIVPDDDTKRAFQESGRDRLITSYKLCLDSTGAVDRVTMLKTSDYPAYDAKIMRAMKGWGYRPYMVSGKAVPVCTAVTFIYSQK
jgi:hypothetical protein